MRVAVDGKAAQQRNGAGGPRGDDPGGLIGRVDQQRSKAVTCDVDEHVEGLRRRVLRVRLDA